MSDASPRNPSRIRSAIPELTIRTYVADKDEALGESEQKSVEPDGIIDHELQAIMARRRHLADAEHRLGRTGATMNVEPGDARPTDLTGLAFSGGGIRSSTFCLGVAQGLHQHGVIDKIDYLSTVSGGSYFGSSLTATMVETGGKFIFGGAPVKSAGGKVAAGMQSSEDLQDSRAIGHLRNYSNYLVPGGFGDFLTAAAVVFRGLAANAALVLWFPLVVAAVTVFANPTRADLTRPDIFGWQFNLLPTEHFAFTLLAVAVALLLLFIWALLRSAHKTKDLPDGRGWEVRFGAALLIIVALFAFFEFQPFAIELLFDADERAREAAEIAANKGVDVEPTSSLLSWLATLLVPITAFVAFFRDTLKGYLADTYYSKTYAALLSRGIAIAIVWVGALALPLLIWIFYVYLCYWAIPAAPPMPSEQTPAWLTTMIAATGKPWLPYLYAGGILAFFAFWLSPNANSLHHLYRDRLARTFHFDPATLPQGPDEKFALTPQADKDPRPLKRKHGGPTSPEEPYRLDDLLSPDAPYHLINTAINVGAGSGANRRGRNADFFLFSPLFVGSRVTGYVPTKAYDDENVAEPIELAKAVAISGAAASSNMGSQTVRALSPTLAMLNIRLGYWLTNPAKVVARVHGMSLAARVKNSMSRKPAPTQRKVNRTVMEQVRDWITGNAHVFLLKEMFGFLREDQAYVYLTDGGHIENLGIYELLRRKCRIIIAVDSEADPQMRFGSFVTLQIYARIDLGIRIELPVDAIREATLNAMKKESASEKADDDAQKKTDAKPAKKPKSIAGPHIAVGCIDYGNNEFGTLIYVKASLTGDENDYVRDYARRNPTFPHESTGDQFFTEEQFEVYRSLGFHCVQQFLSGKDKAVVATSRGPQLMTVKSRNNERIDELMSHLGPF